MKRLLCMVFVLLLSPLAARADLTIVTTTPDFADLARQIGGSHVDVHSVMKGPENAHNVIAKPTEMLFLHKADLFVHSGLDAEPWRDNLLRGARNPKVLKGKPGYVDMSAGVQLLGVPTTGKGDRSQGDMHAYGNPHYQLSPPAAQRATVTLVAAMAQADPANAELYKENAKTVVIELAEMYRKLRAKLAPYAGLKVVTYHPAWIYFAKDFDLDVVTTVEPKPGITPSPAQMRQTIDTMKARDVKIVIVETYNSYNEAKFVADAAGAQLLVLPDHVNGVEGVDTYQKLFTHNVDKLITAAKAAGIEPKKVTDVDPGQ